MNKGLFRFVFGASLALSGAMQASAALYTLTDVGTLAKVDTSSTAGLFNWTVGGTNQVFQNTYLWRIGDSSSADFIQNLTEISSGLTGTRLLDVSYRDAGSTFRIDVSYLLTGGATSFDIAEVTHVTNTSNAPMNFRLFQFNDFDLNGTISNDTVTRLNSSQIKQSDGAVSLNILSQGATPIPSFSELGFQFSVLTDATTSGNSLDTLAGNGIGQNFTGDAGYAFQWNVTLNPGESFTISTDKVAAVPEPATLVALGVGAVGILRRRRKA
jgi:hypothetical protein